MKIFYTPQCDKNTLGCRNNGIERNYKLVVLVIGVLTTSVDFVIEDTNHLVN